MQIILRRARWRVGRRLAVERVSLSFAKSRLEEVFIFAVREKGQNICQTWWLCKVGEVLKGSLNIIFLYSMDW